MKIQEVTSNVDITNKNEKQYVRQIIQLGIPGTQVTFSDKVTTDINGFYGWTSGSIRHSSCKKCFCRWFQTHDTNDK